MNQLNFKALDILHFWADNRNGFVNISKGLTVEFGSDVSAEARHVANFISMIMGCRWTFNLVKFEDKFCFTFCEDANPQSHADMFK